MRRSAGFILLAAMLLLPPRLASADNISDAIAAAGKAWSAGDLAGTRMALGEASQLLAQRAAAKLGAALPAALPGWTAEKLDTDSAGLGMVGGGSRASRSYRNAKGQKVEIQLVADSPLIAPMAMAMANPMMAASMGKLVHVGAQRAIVTQDGDVQMLVDNRILVTLGGDAAIEDKTAYAKAIDLAKLKSK